METIGLLQVVPFAHPQGCRGYLLADQSSKEALALDVHLDLVHDIAARVKAEGWKLCYVVDTHTHADHPSGAADITSQFDCTRMAHEKAKHLGVTIHPKDGERINLGKSVITVRYTPGHTPDHMGLSVDGAFFSGDSLLIDGVARTDFLGSVDIHFNKRRIEAMSTKLIKAIFVFSYLVATLLNCLSFPNIRSMRLRSL